MLAKLDTHDLGRRLGMTIRMLLRFPFSASEPYGYAVKSWAENGDRMTYWSRCPPQSFARAAAEQEQSPDLIDAFYESWCLYDWHGTDVIAGDRQREHCRRTQTLSRSDSVCDMCWLS